jgi:hypothetical protein
VYEEWEGGQNEISGREKTIGRTLKLNEKADKESPLASLDGLGMEREEKGIETDP